MIRIRLLKDTDLEPYLIVRPARLVKLTMVSIFRKRIQPGCEFPAIASELHTVTTVLAIENERKDTVRDRNKATGVGRHCRSRRAYLE